MLKILEDESEDRNHYISDNYIKDNFSPFYKSEVSPRAQPRNNRPQRMSRKRIERE